MLNMGKIGGFIAYLRREKDMTQVELADRLNVSHQAVSKWERGESMPDIGTLPLLARELDVTTDALLAGEADERETGAILEQFVQALAEGHADQAGEMIEAGDVGVSDVSDVAPVLRASTLRQLAPHLMHVPLSSSDVRALAPFLDRDILERLLEQTDHDWTWDELHGMAPFLSRPTLLRCVGELADKEPPTQRGVLRLAPFVDRGALEALIAQVGDAWDWYSITTLAPFVSRETLGGIVEDAVAKEPPKVNTVRRLAPFLNRETMNAFAQSLPPQEWDWVDLTSIAPFVNRELLSSIASHLMSTRPDPHHLARIAPFLDRGELGRLMESVLSAQGGVDTSASS